MDLILECNLLGCSWKQDMATIEDRVWNIEKTLRLMQREQASQHGCT